MKTLPPATNEVPHVTPPTVMRLEISRLAIPKLAVRTLILCCAFATMALFGQTTYVWTNQVPKQLAGDGDIGYATNWSPNAVPVGTTGPDGSGLFGDILVWDGQTTTDLIMTQTGSGVGAGGQSQAAGFGNPTGVRVMLTANQVKSVTVKSPGGTTSGWRFQSLNIAGPGGSFRLGTNNASDKLTITFGGFAGQIQNFVNNSTNPAIINQDLKLQNGGGGAHTLVFDGSGDWIINHSLITENNSPEIITKSGTGTMTWTNAKSSTAALNSFLQGPFTISGGLMILKSSGLFPTVVQAVQNDAILRWDASSQSDSFGGAIAGSGQLQVTSGTLTLGGPNTFTGNISLSGGEVVANSGENVGVSGPLGNGGVISFSGGTLGFGNNTFDYSSRFNTSAGQQYSINTRGQSVAFSNNLASSGATLTKLGDGTLTLAGTNSYSGLTTVSLGTLTLQGPKTGSGNITVADGATLDVFDTGTQVTPATLTLGSSLGAFLEFDNIANTSTAPLAPGTISSTTTTIININSGTFHIGSSYPLLTWSSGSAPAVALGIVEGAGGNLSTNGNTIKFNVSTVALVWNGLTNGTWDITTTTNWTEDGNPTGYSDPKQTVFNDTATGQTNVTISGVVKPEALSVNNGTNSYSLASSAGNSLGGNVRFSKRGIGTLTLTGGANTNTGTTSLRGGTVFLSTLANGGLASDIGAANSGGTNLVFNGGTMQYTGAGASIDRLFRVLGSGGTLDVEGSGPLTLSNPGVISHNGRLTLAGSTADTNTLASALLGGGRLVKDGTGTWVLTGTNAYGGGTTVNNGVLQVGAGGSSGSIGSGGTSLGAGTTLDFQLTGNLTVGGAISGAGSVVKSGSGTVTLVNNNTFSGGITINAGTLQIGNGGSAGELYVNGPIVNNATLLFNSSGTHTYSGGGLISGTGNVVVNGSGLIKVIGANSYTGPTRVDGSSALLPTTFEPCEGQTGALVSPSVTVTNNGRLLLIRQDNGVFVYSGNIFGKLNGGTPNVGGIVMVGANNDNAGDVTLTGTNDYQGGTFIGCNGLILGDGSTTRAGEIVGNVTFTNNFTTPNDNPRTLTFNRPDDFTFSGNIVTNFSTNATLQVNLGIVQKNGAGTLTLTGNNSYSGGTVVNGGFLVVGNGGSSGSLGWGPVSLINGNPLVINRSGTIAQSMGNVSGAADVLIKGGATVTFNGANNTYSGATTVSNGTLIVNGTNITSSTHVYVGGLGGRGTFTGPIILEPGTTLTPGASVGTLTTTDLTVDSSTIVVEINKLLAPSNDIVSVSGTLARNATGGALVVHNLGPNNLVPGDKFTFFSKPLPNGASMSVSGARATWVNNLAVDGSISVNTVISNFPTLNFLPTTTNTLVFSWSDPYNSFKLQAQTNTLNVGISNNWADYPGGASSPITVPIVKTNPAVFFRIISIP